MVIEEVMDSEVIQVSGKPTEKFTGIFEEFQIAIPEGEGSWRALDLIMTKDETPVYLRFFGLDKVKKVSRDGKTLVEIPSNQEIGKLDTSLRALGIRPIYGFENDLVGSFRTEPSLIKKTGTLTPGRIKDNPPYGKQGAEWIVEAVEGLGKPSGTAPASGGTPANMKAKWETFLVKNLKTPLNNAGIIKQVNKVITDATQREALNKSRTAILAEILKEGGFERDGSVYTLELDATGKYSLKKE